MFRLLGRIYDASELGFALLWIGLYCLLGSLANPVSELLGVHSSAQLIVNAALSVTLLLWVKKRGLFTRYGLCRVSCRPSELLWYIPLAVFVSVNLWAGAEINYSAAATVCTVISMLFVGILEELIFRGLLFRAMEKDNLKAAVAVSAVTFGAGHILNLINGSGMSLTANLCQIVGAMACGLMFVVIFCRTGSLIPCIVTHSVNNMLATFTAQSALETKSLIIFSAVNTAIALSYTLLIYLTGKKEKK